MYTSVVHTHRKNNEGHHIASSNKPRRTAMQQMTNGQSTWELMGHITPNTVRRAEAKAVPKPNMFAPRENKQQQPYRQKKTDCRNPMLIVREASQSSVLVSLVCLGARTHEPRKTLIDSSPAWCAPPGMVPLGSGFPCAGASCPWVLLLLGITVLPQEWPILLPVAVAHQPAMGCGFLALLPISSCHGLLSPCNSAARWATAPSPWLCSRFSDCCSGLYFVYVYVWKSKRKGMVRISFH